MGDLERISKKIAIPEKPDAGRFDRVFRALWALCLGAGIPYNYDFGAFESIASYLAWAINNITSILYNPIGELKNRTIELILALAQAFDIKLEILKEE